MSGQLEHPHYESDEALAIAALFSTEANDRHMASMAHYIPFEDREFSNHSILFPNSSDRYHGELKWDEPIVVPQQVDAAKIRRELLEGHKQMPLEYRVSIANPIQPGESFYNCAIANGHPTGMTGLNGNFPSEELNPAFGGGRILD